MHSQRLPCVGRRWLLSQVLLLAGGVAASLLPSSVAAVPRGVDAGRVDLVAAYASDSVFACLDGSGSVPRDQVNDESCDCADGSDEPGTSACPTSTFHCPPVAHRSVTLPSSRVDDGVCDCCDGSDETAESGADCKNTCALAARRLAQEVMAAAELHETVAGHRGSSGGPSSAGHAGSRAAQHAALARLDALQRDAKKMRSEATKQAGMMQQIQTRVVEQHQSGTQPDPQLIQHLQQLHQMQQRNARNAQIVQRLQRAHFGVKMELFTLFSECYNSPPVNEKRLKGGTPNVVPRQYQFVLCPFIEVSQRELNATEWGVQEAAEKMGDRGAATRTEGGASPRQARAEVGEANNATEVGAPTVLGRWGSWARQEASKQGGHQGGRGTDDRGGGLDLFADSETTETMRYVGGESCINGIVRSVNVHVSCGARNAITRVEEDGICIYDMWFTTPVVCSTRQATAYRALLASGGGNSQDGTASQGRKWQDRGRGRRAEQEWACSEEEGCRAGWGSDRGGLEWVGAATGEGGG